MKNTFLALLSFTLISTHSPAAIQVFSDNEFLDVNWQDSVVHDATTTAATRSVQQLLGGHPGAYRRTTHDLAPDAEVTFALGYFFHDNLAVSYNPTTQGAINAFSYSADYIRFSSTNGQGTTAYAMVVQDGIRYLASNGVVISGAYTPFQWNELISGDFFGLDESTAMVIPDAAPNFTDGGTITFGYAFSNTPTIPWSITHGIDNWNVTLDIAPVPEMSTLSMLTAIAALGGVCIRLRKNRQALTAEFDS